jgi:proteic killer suppression protein
MIRSLACADTEALCHSRPVSRLPSIERVTRRKLLQIHATTELASLRVPPGNRLEALKVDRKGPHSIRIKDPWRICFVWKTDGAHRVEIVAEPAVRVRHPSRGPRTPRQALAKDPRVSAACGLTLRVQGLS